MLKKHMPAVWAAVITLACCALLAIGARAGYEHGDYAKGKQVGYYEGARKWRAEAEKWEGVVVYLRARCKWGQ